MGGYRKKELMAILAITTKDISATLAQPKFSVDFKSKCATSLNFSPSKECWRMVHNGKQVITAPFLGQGTTGTRWTLFCADTEEECNDAIKRLGLESLPAVNRSGQRQGKDNRKSNAILERDYGPSRYPS